MKKILSLALAVLMLVSAVPMVYAAEAVCDDPTHTIIHCVGCDQDVCIDCTGWMNISCTNCGGGICIDCVSDASCENCVYYYCTDCGETAFCDCFTDHSNGTAVFYPGQGVEKYTITVPAELYPGDEGIVTLKGTWSPYRTVNVTTDTTVTMEDENYEHFKDLAITFAGIHETGSHDSAQTFTAKISVSNDTTGMMFGDWHGTIYYQVTVTDEY